MEFGVAHSSLGLFRAIKSGEAGLNLNLNDLIDREIEVPSFMAIIKSFFTRRKIIIKVKSYPRTLIDRFMFIQKQIDKEVEKEIEKAKSKLK